MKINMVADTPNGVKLINKNKKGKKEKILREQNRFYLQVEKSSLCHRKELLSVNSIKILKENFDTRLSWKTCIKHTDDK